MARREYIQQIRSEVARRRAEGEPAILTCHWFSDRLDEFLQGVFADCTRGTPSESAPGFSLAAVGGNGRRRPAPYSDVDLLFILEPRAVTAAAPLIARMVRECWDSGLQVGHSDRTPADIVKFAAEEIQFATSLIGMRHVAGNQRLTEESIRQFETRTFRDRSERFVQRCVSSRRDEWMARGNSVNQLEPEIKKSPGGLRDLHLLQWVCFARYGTSDLATLVERGELSEEELRSLNAADEYLTSLRVDLHCANALKQDVLTRDLQLSVTAKRGIAAADKLRAVEVFMHDYFSHTSRVAEVARRVAESPKRQSFLSRLRTKLLQQRSAQGYLMIDGTLVVPEDRLPRLLRDPVAVMDVFVIAAEHNLQLSAEVRQFLGTASQKLRGEPSREASKRFRDVLRFTKGLPRTLRDMYETGYLEWLIPQFSGIRCLIQFNQYHSFTVDEHTMKAMDEMVAFAGDESPVGSAYSSVRHRATLHLAMLMHDIGKGQDGDHSIIGAEICDAVAQRLQMAENKKSMLKLLVLHHLVMPNLAFRRDISDSAVLVEFARLVGAPELLRMLYVLTVADIRAVGPDVWSDWKGELLADLYSRTMQILSGRPYNHLEQDRLRIVRETVRASIAPVAAHNDESLWPKWIEQQLDALPPFYLMTENPERIARDLDMIQQLQEAEVRIEGEYETETDTVSYRVFAPHRFEHGSFHKIAGILSGLRMNILAAQTCMTADSTVIASFRVRDNDFKGTVPTSRIEDVAAAICDVLTARKTVESVFRRSNLFRFNKNNSLAIRTEPQVSIDNDCSERFSIIDVFASDSQGLLYTLARTLFDHGLQVHLARIATHIDQVVDVFYVIDQDQKKLENPERLQKLRSALLEEIRLLGGSA